MKGFTIYINDKKVNIAIKHGVSMIIVDQTCDKFCITVSGLDTERQEHKWWVRQDLTIGDKIKIVATEMEESDLPVKRTIVDRQNLYRRYSELKERLTKKGLLK